MKGYEQFEAIGQALQSVSTDEPETDYLQYLRTRVERVVKSNRVLAQDLREALTWLRRIAGCLRYPPSSFPTADTPKDPLSSEQIKREMEELLQEFQPDLKRRPAQSALHGAWHRLWEDCGSEWLHCYDILGLPPDNLALESLFGRLRNHQRRISGRKSTRELRGFGQCQVLFLAESEQDLLEQICQVPLEEYKERRRRLDEAKAPRRFLYRLHRNPLGTMRRLVDRHAARRAELSFDTSRSPPQK